MEKHTYHGSSYSKVGALLLMSHTEDVPSLAKLNITADSLARKELY